MPSLPSVLLTVHLVGLAPAPGEPASAAPATIRTRYLALEIIATLLFCAIIILWVQR